MNSNATRKTTGVTPRAHDQAAPGAAAGNTGIPARDTGRWSARRPLMLAIAFFIAMFVLFAVGLNLDPRRIPSPLIGKPVPEFSLPPVKGRTLGLSTADIKGEVSLVNVFASWCVACRDEHPILMQLSRRGIVPIHGLNYKDAPDDAAAWLDSLGDPYTRTGADRDGRVGIEWGVYGVPETFVIDLDGRIAYKHIGPISPQALEEMILPLVEKLRQPKIVAPPAQSGAQRP
jgi:cytochrome c biogenesis protein CcmG, thiol:disulfide interchange protein DsbE